MNEIPEQEFRKDVGKYRLVVAPYAPLLVEINRIIEQHGERNALKVVVSSSRAPGLLRDYIRGWLQVTYDFGSMSGESLVETVAKTAFAVYGLYNFGYPQAPEGELPDFGEHVPEGFLEVLLKLSNPYQAFRSIIWFSEYHKLCSEEIERRAQAQPALTALVEWMAADPRKVARRNALKLLRKMSFEHRASKARHYGLDLLATVEEEIERVVEQACDEKIRELTGPSFGKGSDEYLRQALRVRANIRYLEQRFPKPEIAIGAGTRRFPTLSQERTREQKKKLRSAVKEQCNQLIERTAFPIWGDKAPTQAEPELEGQAIVKMQALAHGYGEAMEGLLEGMKYWADNKEVEQIYVEGLKGHLLPSIKTAIWHNRIDAVRRERQQKKIGEKSIDAAIWESQCKGRMGDNVIGLFADDLQADDLQTQGLDMDALTRRERWVLQDYCTAVLQEGYTLNSKQGRSLKQRWGADYTKNIKARARAINHLERLRSMKR